MSNLSQGSKASAEHKKRIPGSMGKMDSFASCPASAGDDSDADGPTLEQIYHAHCPGSQCRKRGAATGQGSTPENTEKGQRLQKEDSSEDSFCLLLRGTDDLGKAPPDIHRWGQKQGRHQLA